MMCMRTLMAETPALKVVGEDASRAAAPGYDHGWFDYAPAVSCDPVRWPDGARTAVSLVLHLGAPEWEPSPPVEPRASGGRGLAPAPDFPRMSHREFGHRVGALRLAGMFAAHRVRPAVAVDVLTAEHYPGLLAELPASEHLAAGLSAARPITSVMAEDEERDYIGLTLDRLEVALGTRPSGWIGPERSESARTPGLLGAAGLSYVADWCNDDRPYRVGGAPGSFWSFPLSWELSDEAACFHRGVAPATWARSVLAAFDRLHEEGGRMLALHLQPWVSGQAYRAAAVEAILAHLTAAAQVWFASPAAIVAHCEAESR
jgi:allantoinase